MTPRLVILVGPTGAGKSALALRIGEKFGAEIVSADSQQVYRGMDIGTAKATREQRQRVPHHLLDVLDPSEEMSAQTFVDKADQAIALSSKGGRPVIVAGGTGLYVRALLFGLFTGPAKDEGVRDKLKAESQRVGIPALWERLKTVDPAAAEQIMSRDLRRIIRALEVHELTGIPLSEHHRRHQENVKARYPAIWIGISPEREILYQRIDKRVDQMMADGFVEEVKGLREKGVTRTMRSQAAIGYSEIHSVLEGELPLNDAVVRIKRNSRRYARRQLSWYRCSEQVRWYAEGDLVDPGVLESYLEENVTEHV